MAKINSIFILLIVKSTVQSSLGIVLPDFASFHKVDMEPLHKVEAASTLCGIYTRNIYIHIKLHIPLRRMDTVQFSS